MGGGIRCQRRLVLRVGGALVLGGGFATIAALQARASEPARPTLELLAVRPEKLELRAGETVRVAFDLESPRRWHFYPAARTPLLGRQTEFRFDGAEVAGPIVEPRPRIQRDGGLESDFHEGRVTITVPVRIAAGVAAGAFELKGRVVYQLCDWNLCLNGETPFRIGLRVIAGAPAPGPAQR